MAAGAGATGATYATTGRGRALNLGQIAWKPHPPIAMRIPNPVRTKNASRSFT